MKLNEGFRFATEDAGGKLFVKDGKIAPKKNSWGKFYLSFLHKVGRGRASEWKKKGRKARGKIIDLDDE